METLALPNIYFDLAAVPFNVQPETYPFPTGLAFIKSAKDIVGVDKLMWGTDVPSVLIQNSYPVSYTHLDVYKRQCQHSYDRLPYKIF